MDKKERNSLYFSTGLVGQETRGDNTIQASKSPNQSNYSKELAIAEMKRQTELKKRDPLNEQVRCCPG